MVYGGTLCNTRLDTREKYLLYELSGCESELRKCSSQVDSRLTLAFEVRVLRETP